MIVAWLIVIAWGASIVWAVWATWQENVRRRDLSGEWLPADDPRRIP